MLEAISHIALIVRDPTRTAAFFHALFDAAVHPHSDGDGHEEVAVRLGNTWFVLIAAEVERPLTGDHVAFRVDAEQLQAFAERLKRMGHAYQLARGDTALYFSDFDNHVFELESVGFEPEAA